MADGWLDIAELIRVVERDMLVGCYTRGSACVCSRRRREEETVIEAKDIGLSTEANRSRRLSTRGK
jgi:hypothetical protein